MRVSDVCIRLQRAKNVKKTFEISRGGRIKKTHAHKAFNQLQYIIHTCVSYVETIGRNENVSLYIIIRPEYVHRYTHSERCVLNLNIYICIKDFAFETTLRKKKYY